MNRFAMVLILSCASVACQPRDSTPGATASSDTARSGSTLNALPAAQDTTRPGARSVLLALDGEGLRVVLPSNGSTRLLAFGMEATDVLTAVSAAMGAPTSRGTNADCGAGAMEFVVFADGLSLAIQNDRFVGWSARAGTSGGTITTMSGVGVGSTRAALDSSYAANVAPSTLGVEFTAGGIAGVLESEASSARITDLWAGANCVAR